MGNAPRTPMLPLDLQRSLQSQLWPNEKIIWSAQPNPAAFRASFGTAIVGLCFAGFGAVALGFVWHARTLSTRLLAGLCPGASILLGLAFMSAPFSARRRASQKIYAVTDRRAMILWVSSNGESDVQSYTPDRLGAIERRERSDGSGDLILERYNHATGQAYSSDNIENGFRAIENVHAVQQLIATTLLSGPEPAAS